MSPSEPSAKLSVLVTELRVQIEQTVEGGELAQVPVEVLTNLMSAAVKLYAASVEELEPGADTSPIVDDTVSTTEAIVVASALLRAHHLNPFDLALWFSRTAKVRGHQRVDREEQPYRNED
jgi:hypothetical protein